MSARQILGDLFENCLRLIDRAPEAIACPHIVSLLKTAIQNPKLVAANLFPSKGWVVTNEREHGLAILTHRHPEPVWSNPHDHGRTWAIYGQITGRTAMYDYTPLAGKQVRLTHSYWIEPGEARWYPTGAIHSHHTYGDCYLIRIEGMNMHRPENKVGGRDYEMKA